MIKIQLPSAAVGRITGTSSDMSGAITSSLTAAVAFVYNLVVGKQCDFSNSALRAADESTATQKEHELGAE